MLLLNLKIHYITFSFYQYNLLFVNSQIPDMLILLSNSLKHFACLVPGYQQFLTHVYPSHRQMLHENAQNCQKHCLSLMIITNPHIMIALISTCTCPSLHIEIWIMDIIMDLQINTGIDPITFILYFSAAVTFILKTSLPRPLLSSNSFNHADCVY